MEALQSVPAVPAQEAAMSDALLTDSVSWLPASAWGDQEIRAYVFFEPQLPQGEVICSPCG